MASLWRQRKTVYIYTNFDILSEICCYGTVKSKSMRKYQVYLMPGLAASSKIFEHIHLPDDEFELHPLEWEIPQPDEKLSDYARRLAAKITKPDPVLVGVSFGGILVQEMASFLNPLMVIIISSVKSNTEYPGRFRFAKHTGAHKLLPLSLLSRIDDFKSLPLGKTVNSRLRLYQKFLAMRDMRYLQWAVQQVVDWDRIKPLDNVVHIHGDDDMIFPIKYIKPSYVVKGGTHIMVLTKARWLNKHLPGIIREHTKEKGINGHV